MTFLKHANRLLCRVSFNLGLSAAPSRLGSGVCVARRRLTGDVPSGFLKWVCPTRCLGEVALTQGLQARSLGSYISLVIKVCVGGCSPRWCHLCFPTFTGGTHPPRAPPTYPPPTHTHRCNRSVRARVLMFHDTSVSTRLCVGSLEGTFGVLFFALGFPISTCTCGLPVVFPLLSL